PARPFCIRRVSPRGFPASRQSKATAANTVRLVTPVGRIAIQPCSVSLTAPSARRRSTVLGWGTKVPQSTPSRILGDAFELHRTVCVLESTRKPRRVGRALEFHTEAAIHERSDCSFRPQPGV